jgi:hypothetical protein
LCFAEQWSDSAQWNDLERGFSCTHLISLLSNLLARVWDAIEYGENL